MNLKEIKSYDDSYWLHHLKDRTIFDTDNIRAQKDWLIERLEQAEKALTYYAEEPYLGSIGYSAPAIDVLKAIKGEIQ